MENITYEEAKAAKEILIKYLEQKDKEGMKDDWHYKQDTIEAVALLALEEIL